ncbi:unnamed protein product [Bemisia tabaci]|uniref:Uncharacterized protein n=1 Tax=Bemisia tabaci TaxID=7038 RepID=A0A9P0ALJ5_BEMTA|nr:unnamed protein product [Bemisia tabaci]
MALRHAPNTSSTSNHAKTDAIGKHTPPNKAETDRIRYDQQFIDSIPAVTSHYRRKNRMSLKLKTMFVDIQDWAEMEESFKMTCVKNRKQNLNISKVSSVVFTKNQPISVYYGYKNPTSESFLIESKLGSIPFQPKQAYSERLPISTSKCKDLMKLVQKKIIIPEAYAPEYEKMLYGKNFIDTLPETDEKDVDEPESSKLYSS